MPARIYHSALSRFFIAIQYYSGSGRSDLAFVKIVRNDRILKSGNNRYYVLREKISEE